MGQVYKLYVYIVISITWAAMGLLHFVEWRKHHQRKTDLAYSAICVLCSVSFGFYGAENFWTASSFVQLIVDTMIFISLLYLFVRSAVSKIKGRA